MRTRIIGLGCLALAFIDPAGRAADGPCQWICVAKDGKHFVLSDSKSQFHPWGFNYDHDASDRLLEEENA